jgi:hypothetical protein
MPTITNPNNVNQAAMRAVADVIEYANRLNMDTYGSPADDPEWIVSPAEVWEDCGTVACIGGWACAWADRQVRYRQDYRQAAIDELGLTNAQANRLLFGYDNFWEEHNLNTDSKVAADVLRKIASGEIIL